MTAFDYVALLTSDMTANLAKGVSLVQKNQNNNNNNNNKNKPERMDGDSILWSEA